MRARSTCKCPPGITDGQALRIAGSGRRPALIFRVKLRPHALYPLRRAGTCRSELPLAPWEAALGTKVAVPTLGGTVELTIPAGAQSGQKLRLRGRGLPGAPAGDQFVIIKLVTPAADTDPGQGGLRAHEARFQVRSARGIGP